MYECFHCLTRGVICDSDYSFEDLGYEGEGIVHMCHCVNCGAWIEYAIRIDDEGGDVENDKSDKSDFWRLP